jgi:hypothetical protein
VSDTAYKKVAAGSATFDHRSIGSIRPKGSTKLIGIVEVCDADSSDLREHKVASKRKFERAVRLRRHGAVAAARLAFEEVQAEAAKLNVEDTVVTLKLSHDGAIDDFAQK